MAILKSLVWQPQRTKAKIRNLTFFFTSLYLVYIYFFLLQTNVLKHVYRGTTCYTWLHSSSGTVEAGITWLNGRSKSWCLFLFVCPSNFCPWRVFCYLFLLLSFFSTCSILRERVNLSLRSPDQSSVHRYKGDFFLLLPNVEVFSSENKWIWIQEVSISVKKNDKCKIFFTEYILTARHCRYCHTFRYI